MESLTGRLAGLSADKRELLEALLRKKRARPGAAATGIRRRSAGPGPWPLSFPQERLWLVDRLDPGTPAYNMPLALRLSGTIDPALLARVFAEIVRRHEALRTTFTDQDGRPAQAIGPAAESPPPLPVIDLSRLEAGARDGEAARLVRAEAGRGFDLARGPLLRLALLRLDAREHLLLVTLHHIVSDGWSMGVLLREIHALLPAFTRGLPSPLPELAVQYADFAVWQRARLQGEALAAQLDWWRRELAGAATVLELPTDRPRTAAARRAAGLSPFALPAGLSAGLQELARREGATLFMLLTAAFQALLHRLSGQQDVLVGTPVANRGEIETEALIGFFVNTLVLRGRFGGQPSFRGLLAQTRETVLGAFERQDLPFERLVEELVTDRDVLHTPLIQVLFALQNAPLPPLELPGLALRAVPAESGAAKLDLTLTLQEAGGALVGMLEYDAGLFDRPTAEHLLARFALLLGGAAADPDREIGALPLLAPAERHQALVEWNDTAGSYPREASLPELFAEVARARPEAPALVAPDGAVWSYRRLDEAASRLAHRLRALGTGPETAVGICMERSPELILGILAILKAGGAYVPLDAGYPDERLALMLEDTGARVVLVHEPTRGRLTGLAQVMEVEGEDGPQEPGSPLHPPAPESLALVIYTSGSTGRPKGVALSHRGIVRLARNHDSLRIGPGDRVAHAATISFDAATLEIWGALLNGAPLVLVPRETVLSPADLTAHLRRTEVTALFLTTALFNQVAREEPAALARLRLAMFGGEAADPAAVACALAAGGPERLLHLYGPAESTTLATWWRVREVPPGASAVPIGRPLDNSAAYVLDPRQEPIPPGTVGELHVGGDGLARGYLNRPELTAERFVPHPWGTGERLYRTGDLVRQRPGGAIEFVGRGDGQVKIRGFRIEPGEIEGVLGSHPEVRGCVVGVRGGLLVAWVVLDPSDSSDPTDSTDPHSALAAWLRGKLPEFMVPSVFLALDALPLSANGKVDRLSLPEPDRMRRRAGATVAPRTPTEEVLAALWRELLGLEQVGVEERFFELGGHSLLAARLLSRVRQTFHVELPLREIFEHATIAALAARIDAVSKPPEVPSATAIRRRRGDGPWPLSFSQERLWLIDRLDPGTPAYNMPLALRLSGELAPDLLARVFAAIVRRHEALRTTFAVRAGRPVQEIRPPAPLPLPLIDLSRLDTAVREEEALGLARAEARRSFDLERGPLLRSALVRLGAGEHLLLLTVHHIVSDGWSMGVLQREIQTLLTAFARGLPSPLPELPVQYADFAAWQRGVFQGEVLAAQLAWWRTELAGAPVVLDLPLDRPRSPRAGNDGAFVPFTLPAGLAAGLRALAGRGGATLFMVLLAAFQALLHRLAGQEDVLVGTPVANRGRLETEGLIGFFVNTLVLRGRFEGASGFTDFLARTLETVLGAFEHQDAPFERLVEELVPVRDLSVAPLFQVVFSMQTAPAAPLSLPGLTLEALPVHSGKAQFDLSLNLVEAGGALRGALEINRALFDRVTAQRMIEAFVHLLRGAVDAPERRIAEIPLLGEGERHQVLREWNEGGVLPAGGDSILPLFERQAALAPDAPALSQGERRFTYGDLDRQAEHLAGRLRRLGVGPETRVAVVAERSPELIVAFLGILKAGGAYVPVDPAYPEERRAFLLADSGAVVGGEEGEDKDDRDGKVGRDGFPEAAGLAYVLYTSGSTGRPKGVMVSHGALARYVEAVRPVYGIAPGDRVLQFCSTSFDTSLEEIVPCLTSGAELVLRTDAMLGSVAIFLDSCRAQGITVLSLPTAYWHEIVAKLESEGLSLPSCLRLVVLGGERALPERLAAWRRLAPGGPRLLNTYGVTEATIVSTAVDLSASPETRGEVPIGRAIGGTEVYLLDREGVPVPVGAAGELLIGGGLLARGYLGRPDLTAERFVPHPFAAEPGARLYRSGDLARALPDGRLGFAGRADRQVKVRGYRIEIEEIEARLLRHPEVESAVVAVREDRPGEKRIVAYIVPRTLPGPAPAALRAFVRETLPDYMTPGAWVPLTALPLTPNGKLDRGALPAPEPSFATEERAAPSEPVEELLAGIWAEVLGRERVGVRDDFFALGGHSLLATQVVSRIRGVLGAEIPLRQLFETPTVAELARAVRTARQEAPSEPILRAARPVGEDLPLSFAQQRLWLIDQLEPDSPAYNMPSAVRLRGAVSPALLERIFGEIVRRHEALRTTFAVRGGRPVQVIAPARPVALPLVDLSLLPPSERESQALRLAGEEARRPFDLETGPLLRLCLLRLAAHEHVLLATLHHIVSDGWSMGVLQREIQALLAAFSQRLPSPLPELPVQYADFALWQRDRLQGDLLAAQLDWWRRELAGTPAVLDLPTDRPRTQRADNEGALVPFTLPAGPAAGLRELARQGGATLFMVLLAAFQALLHRLGGAEDVLVGTPVANRGRLETEGLIGFFVNTLVLRGRFAGASTVEDLLGRTRETVLGAFAHQDAPFERLVEELVPDRDLAAAPLVQVLFSMQAPAAAPFVLPGLTLEGLPLHSGKAQFDLSLDLIEAGGGLHGGLEIRRALFDAVTAQRMLESLGHLLRGIAASPERRIAEIPLLGAAERHQILREWAGGEALSQGASSILPLFEHRAALAPDAPALSQGEQRLTYGELDRAADRLARRLRRRGVGPETRVAVVAERAPELIIAFLGILKAGGAYVPVDPAYPAERRAFMVADAGAVVLGEIGEGREDKDEKDGRDGFPEAEGLAYVLYTSGSTGRPKGVMVSHGALARYVEAVRPVYGIGPGDRVLQFCSTSFDTSLEEIVPCLTSGAELVLRTDAMLGSVALFLDSCRAQGITVLSLPTAYWHEIVAKVETEGLRLPGCLRLVILGGERALLARVGVWRRFAPELPRLVNTFGVTESTIVSTAIDLSLPSAAEARGEVSIGRPLAGTDVHLLDPAWAPVPIGTVGELLLGGALLARGYLGRPDLTADRFVPHPFAATPGARLYRTGDLARFLPDGQLEYAGRGDRQVKIRGYRIETGEIEARLLQHPGIESAVVAVREDRPGEKLLAAYLVPRSSVEDAPAPAALRDFVREALPDYMVPAAFVLLDALPLSPNGKVDRGALPAPERAAGVERLDPRDALELRLVQLFEEVLGAGPVGVRDDFFSLGGHSLLAARLTFLLRERLGREVPLVAILRHPTVERLAALLREEQGAPPPRGALVELAAGSGKPLFLVHAVGGEVLSYVHLARHLAPERSVYGLQVPDRDTPWETVEEMAAGYLQAISEVQPRGPYALGGWSMGGVVAFEMARQLEAASEAVEIVLLLDSYAPGAVTEEPLSGGALVASFAYDLARLLGIDLTGAPAGLAEMEAGEALRRLTGLAREAGLLPPGFDLPELERRFATFARCSRALERYTGGACAAPLLLLRAAGEHPVSPDDLGWRRLARGPFEVYEAPGDHYTLLLNPDIETLARLLCARLA